MDKRPSNKKKNMNRRPYRTPIKETKEYSLNDEIVKKGKQQSAKIEELLDDTPNAKELRNQKNELIEARFNAQVTITKIREAREAAQEFRQKNKESVVTKSVDEMVASLQEQIDKMDNKIDKIEKRQIGPTSRIRLKIAGEGSLADRRSSLAAFDSQINKNKILIDESSGRQKKKLTKKTEKLERRRTGLVATIERQQVEVARQERIKSKVTPTPIKNFQTAGRSVRRAVSGKMKEIGKVILKGLKQVFVAIGQFFVSNPVGWFIGILLIIMLIIVFWALSVKEKPLEEHFVYKPDPLEMEYRELVKAIDKRSDKFYEEYRVVLPSKSIASIIYTYKDSQRYDSIMSKHYFANGDDLQKSFELGIEEYLGSDMNPYNLGKLFLEKVNYQYTYLSRTWSDWTYFKEYDEAVKHNEMIEYTATCTRYIDIYEQVPDVSQCRPSDPKCLANPPLVDKWVGTKQEKYDCQKWKYRDITSEKWVADIADPNIDYYRPSLNVGLPQIDPADQGWEWIYYDDRGVPTKKNKYWTMKSFDEVARNIAYDYHPQSTKYPGDTLVIPAKELNDYVDISMPKKEIYTEYYIVSDFVIQENYFLPDHMDDDYQRLLFMKEILDQIMYSFNFQMAEGKFILSPVAACSSNGQQAITQGFDVPDYASGGTKIHGAIDISRTAIHNSGTFIGEDANNIKIVASLDGVVTMAGSSCRDNVEGKNCIPGNEGISGCYITCIGPNGYPGNRIVIKSTVTDVEGVEHNIQISYVHLQQGSTNVKVGDVVKMGDVIATMGNSGWSTGTHIHWQVKDLDTNQELDPTDVTQWTQN